MCLGGHFHRLTEVSLADRSAAFPIPVLIGRSFSGRGRGIVDSCAGIHRPNPTAKKAGQTLMNKKHLYILCGLLVLVGVSMTATIYAGTGSGIPADPERDHARPGGSKPGLEIEGTRARQRVRMVDDDCRSSDSRA